MSAHVLVYGAGGQAGREFLALARLHELTVTGLTHIQCDIADEDSVQRSLDETTPSIVINAAAYTAVDRAEREEAAAFRANALGPQVLAKATARRAIPLVHLSTDYVFDGAKS